MIVYARCPVLSEVCDDASVFRDDMLARYECDAAVAWASVAIGDDISELDEGVSPISAVEDEAAEAFEPCLVEVMKGLLVLRAVVVDELEGLGHDEPLPLRDAPREMGVDLDIAIDVVEALTVGRIDIDGHLPGVTPVSDVLACEGVGGALKADDDGLDLFGIVGLGEVEVAVWSVQEAVGAACQLAEECFYIHSCDGVDGLNGVYGEPLHSSDLQNGWRG